jgi:hypothetical protein
MADNQRPDGADRRVTEEIAVPSQDPAGKENKEKTYDPKGKQVDGKKETKEEEMVSGADSARGDVCIVTADNISRFVASMSLNGLGHGSLTRTSS